MNPTITQSRGDYDRSRGTVARHGPSTSAHERPDVIDPVRISCPKCDTQLGHGIRVTLESAWSAGKRPALREAYLSCPNCRRAWVVTLQLSIAAFAGSEAAA